MDRRTTIAVLLLALPLGAAVAMVALGGSPHVEPVGDRPAGNPTTTSSPSTHESIMPTAGTAASTRLVQDFDILPTGSDVPEWASTDTVILDVAAVPTAVDRSARLTAEGMGSACRPLSAEIVSLTADFMIEPLPTDGFQILAIELADGSVVTLSVTAEGAQLTDSSDPIGIEARAWYRWSVSRNEGWFELALFDVDGAALRVDEVEARDAAAKRFCISTEAPTRVYLDALTVEGH
jgi:hypothetical protein